MVRVPWKLVLTGAAGLVVASAFGNGNVIHLKKLKNPFRVDETSTWRIAYKQVKPDLPSKVASVYWGHREKQKVVALTFDDGPHQGFTSLLVNALKKEGVPATFFVVGKQVDKFPALVKYEADSGFAIGNHSYSHVTLTNYPMRVRMTEFQACDDAIFSAAHVRPEFCRPPGGDIDPITMGAASRLGLRTVLWSDDPGDYKLKSSTEIANRTLAGLTDGGIILLHDGNPATLEALPAIISRSRKMGYRFVRLNDLRFDHIRS